MSWGPQHLSKSTVISFRKSSLRTCLPSASRVIQTLCKSYMLIATTKSKSADVLRQGFVPNAKRTKVLLAHLLRHWRIRLPLHACSKPWSHIAPPNEQQHHKTTAPVGWHPWRYIGSAWHCQQKVLIALYQF